MNRPHPLRAGWPWLPVALLVAACTGRGDGSPESAPLDPSQYPAGTVYAVDGVPISAAEIDRWAEVTGYVEPQFVLNQWRRTALSNIVLPIRTAHALDPEGRDAAFADAERLRGEALEHDALPASAVWSDHAEGSWDSVGLVDWHVARELEVGEWSPLYETIGGWAFFRLLERPAEWTPTCEIRLERVHVFFLDPEGLRVLVNDAMVHLPKDIVDPAWEAALVPEYLESAAVRRVE